jgi:uncharacterized protein with GYD domain
MPFYMTQFGYTAEAWASLAKKPEDRSKAVSALIEKFGGRMHQMYYSFGKYDGVIIFEAPDDQSAAAVAVAAVGPGHVAKILTTPLFTIQEAMTIMARAGKVGYSAPSGK